MLPTLLSIKNIRLYLSAIVVAALLNACGGGGGDGTTGYPSITYTGSTSAAVIDQDTAADYPFVFLENSGDAGNLPIAASIDTQAVDSLPDTENIQKVADLVTNLVKSNFFNNAQQVAGATTSQTGTCGGKISYTENSSNTSFSGSLIFDHYCEGGLNTYGYEFRLHGKMTFSGTYHLVNNSPVFDTLSFNIQYLKMTFNDGITTASEEFSGSISVTSFDAANNPLDFNVTINFKYAGKVFKVVNLQADDIAGTISGRLYHPDHGYVDIITTSPFTYMINDPADDTDDQYCSGSLQITGVDTLGNTATIDFTDYSCTTYDICITIDPNPQVCSLGNDWGTAPVW
jgi:hypothetical protein